MRVIEEKNKNNGSRPLSQKMRQFGRRARRLSEVNMWWIRKAEGLATQRYRLQQTHFRAPVQWPTAQRCKRNRHEQCDKTTRDTLFRSRCTLIQAVQHHVTKTERWHVPGLEA